MTLYSGGRGGNTAEGLGSTTVPDEFTWLPANARPALADPTTLLAVRTALRAWWRDNIAAFFARVYPRCAEGSNRNSFPFAGACAPWRRLRG